MKHRLRALLFDTEAWFYAVVFIYLKLYHLDIGKVIAELYYCMLSIYHVVIIIVWINALCMQYYIVFLTYRLLSFIKPFFYT